MNNIPYVKYFSRERWVLASGVEGSCNTVFEFGRCAAARE